MASAILVALNQTHLKAQAEYQTLVEAAQGNPFAPGVSAAGHLIETFKPALRQSQAHRHLKARQPISTQIVHPWGADRSASRTRSNVA